MRSSDVFEPDMEAHGRPAGRPFGRGADVHAVERNCEALEAAPRRADAEQLSALMKAFTAVVRHRLEYDAEKAACAGEIALPEGVTGTLSSAGCSTRAISGRCFEPARDLQAGG